MENKENRNSKEGRDFVLEMNWIENVQPVVEKYAFTKEMVIGTAAIVCGTWLTWKIVKLFSGKNK